MRYVSFKPGEIIFKEGIILLTQVNLQMIFTSSYQELFTYIRKRSSSKLK